MDAATAQHCDRRPHRYRDYQCARLLGPLHSPEAEIGSRRGPGRSVTGTPLKQLAEEVALTPALAWLDGQYLID